MSLQQQSSAGLVGGFQMSLVKQEAIGSSAWDVMVVAVALNPAINCM